jgi:ABC-type transport system substrate-binding protein
MSPATQVKAEDIQTNFDAWFFTQAGSRITEAYALYIKQALAPLGINVKVVAKPFGQFVGDLLHYTTGHPFDLAQIRFSGGSLTPSFKWAYHSSDTSFGIDMYQLDNPDFQAFQAVDAGVQTAEVDALIDAIEYELDLPTRKALVDQFAELYMTKLLYDFPMVSTNFRTTMWKGFGGDQNQLWDPDEGILASIGLGASWTSNQPIRAGVSNTTTIRLSTVNPASPLFDPQQSHDTATSAITNIMTDASINFDKGFIPHPGLAYQWAVKDSVSADFDNNASTPNEVSANGEHVFFIRDNAVWPATTDYTGAPIASTPLTAKDLAFAMQIYKLANVVVNGKELFTPLYDVNVTTTITTDDTLHVYIKPGLATPDDIVTFGGVTAMPAHILNGTLHYIDENGTTTMGNIYELDAQGINVQETEEWTHWASMDGHSLVGAYDITEYVDNSYRSYVARSDYYFPNEAEIVDMHAAHASAFAPYEAANSFNESLAYWAPNVNTEAPSPFYWNFDTSSGLAIKQWYYTVIEDTNAALLAFEAGAVDTFSPTALGAQKVAEHQANPNYVVKVQTPVRGPELLVFNVLNPHLRKINVRLAIAHAIDKQQLIKIHDGFAREVDSPVWLSSGEYWYTPFPVAYDYATARDLMRGEGYFAAETNNVVVTAPPPPVSDVVTTISSQIENVVTEGGNKIVSNLTEVLGSSFLMFFSSFALITITVLRKKK